MNTSTASASFQQASLILAKVRQAFGGKYDTSNARIVPDYLNGHTAIVWSGTEKGEGSPEGWAETFANRNGWQIDGIHCEAYQYDSLIVYPQ